MMKAMMMITLFFKGGIFPFIPLYAGKGGSFPAHTERERIYAHIRIETQGQVERSNIRRRRCW